MRRPYTADTSAMRVLVLAPLAALLVAAPATASTPRFGLYDLDGGLAAASHNVYGDVRVVARKSVLAAKAPGATLVRCATDCRLGRGWLAFAKAPLLAGGDVRSARAHAGRSGWNVSVVLTPRAETRWRRIAARAKLRTARTGLPAVYAIVIDGAVSAAPYSSALPRRGPSLELTGFSKTGARRAAALLGG